MGALFGGYRLGQALAVLSGEDRSALDLASALLAAGLLVMLGRQIDLAADCKALRAYALIIVACTVLVYIAH